MSLVLSTDAKPRLKWTPELHQRFVDAISQLGGADKATPKTLMRVMGIPGLTLYHLKSHLQKYRLGKSQQLEAYSDNKEEAFPEADNYTEKQREEGEIKHATQNQINESLEIAKAIQLQMEVQRKLHEQIEVQRHLQLRIEAQGKYLHSVLKKAQETLAGYSSSNVGVEIARAELSQLVSMVDNRCPSSPFSELAETGNSILKIAEKVPIGQTVSSIESSLTSSESSERKEDKMQQKNECDRASLFLPLMEIHHKRTGGRKRSGSTFMDGNCVDQPSSKRSPTSKEKSGYQMGKMGIMEMLDLNR